MGERLHCLFLIPSVFKVASNTFNEVRLWNLMIGFATYLLGMMR